MASSSSPPVSSYAPPTALEDLHILDFLELAGSQAKAGAALAMHQSTVCRSLQLAEHVGDQQILLKDRRIQLTQAELIGFFDGATLGG